MNIIVKIIIFAVLFPLGMGLIYRFRRNIKGKKVITDSNFVKVSRKKYIIIGIVNVILLPLGIMGILGMIYELKMIFSQVYKGEWVTFVIEICLVFIAAYYLYLFITFRNKIEIIDDESIKIFKGKKGIQLNRREITYKYAENVIRIYNKSGKRIISITHLYENTQKLIKWLEKEEKINQHIDDIFYEDGFK